MAIGRSILTTALAFGFGVNAQVQEWGQCGGINYSGPTACVAGTFCKEQNPWYYQCLRGTGTLTTSTTTTKSTPPTSTSTSSGSAPTGATKYFITFGDSYSQTGFDITSTKPSASSILGNPAFPGWTTSGGLNWIDYLISQHNTTLTLSYNFAYGGATTNASLVAPYTSTVLSFIDQVTEFSGSIASKPSYAPWTSSNALVGVWMGVNDVGNSYWLSNETAVLDAIMDSYFGQLQILYNSGVRNFALLNVPPTEKSPLMASQGTSVTTKLASVIGQYNDLISRRLAQFKSANAGTSAVVVDTQAPFNKALNNPTAYGASSNGASCYNSDGVTCLWFNDYHPATAIHSLVADAVASALPSWFN